MLPLETTIKISHNSFAINNTDTGYIVYIGTIFICRIKMKEFSLHTNLEIVQLTSDKPLEFKVQ